MSCTITEHEVQVVVIPDDCNAEPVVITAVDGTAVHYEPEPTVIEINAGPRGLPGTDVELRKTATHLQWRPRKDGAEWADLVPLVDLVGPQSYKAGDFLFSVAPPGPDWVLCDGSVYAGGGPLAALLPGGVLPDFTGSQVPTYINKSSAGGGTNIYVDTNDPRLSDAREWTAATVDQAEAEAGTATTRRAWTAQRVRQAMLGWWGGFAAKTTPVDADSIVIADSAASNAPKRLSWANAVAKLRGTFVEGPAFSVDGQVMVFDGATGKKAKSAGYAPSEVLISRQTKTGNTIINVTAVDFVNNSFYAAAHGLTTQSVIAWRMKNPPGITGTNAEKELWKFFLLKNTWGYVKVIDADNFQVCSNSAATAVIPLMNASTYDLSRVHFEKVNSLTFAAFDASGFKKIRISVFGAGNHASYLVFGNYLSTIQGLRSAPATAIQALYTYDDANNALAAAREYTLYVHQDGIAYSALVSGMCLDSSGQIVMRNNLVSTTAFIPIDPSVVISNIRFDAQILCNGAELIVTGTK